MDRRSWLWKRKSSEKSPGETESSESVSSHSERYSDDLEVQRVSSNNISPTHAQSPEDSSNKKGSEVPETIKSLSEKLSAAILNISAKEELVQQHVKIAEEAVSGWEKAEAEVVALKQQIEIAARKNSVLEDGIGHLDGALQESVGQLRQSKEEQDHKIHDVLMQKTREWDSDKLELENQIANLQEQLHAVQVETLAFTDHSLQSKLEAAEKENMALKFELLARTEDLKMQNFEKELSTRVAESASKQHLESMKKVSKLEAECRRLRTAARRASLAPDHKPVSNSVYVESLTDSQSDSGERLLSVEDEPNSDLWATALIAGLDQVKNSKVRARKLASSGEIDIMDDFLEMEKFAAVPDAGRGSLLKVELDSMREQITGLEDKIAKMEAEKVELQMLLADSQNQLEFSRNQAIVAEDKLVELQKHLDCANESKLDAMTEVVRMEERGNLLLSQLELSESEVQKLHENVNILQGQVEKEKTISAELAAKLEALETTKKALEHQVDSASFEVKKLTEKLCMIEVQVEDEKMVSSEYTAMAEVLLAEKRDLECQLKSAEFEIEKLNRKVDKLEAKVEDEKAISAELTAQVEDSQNERKVIETQLQSAFLEIQKLHENATTLECQIEEESSLSAELATKLEAAEQEKKTVDIQLGLAYVEVGELRDNVGLLEKKLDEERALFAELASKHQSLDDSVSRKKQVVEIQRMTGLDSERKTKQEKEMAMAAEKMAECQKTIASLTSQLKSLASLDDFAVEFEKPELIRASPDTSNVKARKSRSTDHADGSFHYVTPNGKEKGTSSSSSPSSGFSGFARLMSLSRSNNHTEK